MGEAKRRKQKLGEQYGKVPSVLRPGTAQYEQQVEKLMMAWYAQVEDINSEFRDSEAEPSAEDEGLTADQMDVFETKMQAWLTDYFQPYRAQDRQALIAGVLDPQYAQINDMTRNTSPTDQDLQKLQDWMMETLHLFSIVKPLLSKPQLQRYGEPLKSFYDLARQEAEANDDDQQMEDLNLLFAPCLDL